MVIDGLLRSYLVTDYDYYSRDVTFQLGHTVREETNDLYIYSDLEVKDVSVETFKPLAVSTYYQQKDE